MSPKPLSDRAYARMAARTRGEVSPNAYAQGKRLEAKVIAALREAGFITMRSAGSKGAIDVLAVRPGECLMIQVKRTTPPGPAAWNLLFDLAEWCGAVPLLATCEPYRPIRYERLIFKKPLPRAREIGSIVRPTGLVPYPLSPTAVIEESETEPEEGENRW